VFFKGVNAVTKGAPWYPEYKTFNRTYSLAEDDFKIMQDLGINLVRLGVMWPGAEPTQGH